jgi:hypothetical protein
MEAQYQKLKFLNDLLINYTLYFSFNQINMMKTLLILYVTLNVAFTLAPNDVYICSNKTTDKYHYSSTCRGLSNCQFKILKLSLQKAKSKGMTLCAWESKK